MFQRHGNSDKPKDWFPLPEYRAIKDIEQHILNVINDLEYQDQQHDVRSDYNSNELIVINSNEKMVFAVVSYMKNNLGTIST